MKIVHRVEVEPFALWLKVKLKRFDNIDALAYYLQSDSTWIGKIMHLKYRTIEVDKVDEILCIEGGTHLRELYPELYEEINEEQWRRS